MSEKVFEGLPCIVELFGHQQIAGKLTEVAIGGSALIRVDVPQVDGQAAFTKFYGTGAIYAITPTDEETMLAAVRGFKVEPIQRWRLLPENVQTRDSDWDSRVDENEDF
jgi:hypothetical protein